MIMKWCYFYSQYDVLIRNATCANYVAMISKYNTIVNCNMNIILTRANTPERRWKINKIEIIAKH